MSRTQDGDQSKQGDEGGVHPLLARHGGLSYLEIPANDARRSAAFYESVLGWKLDGDEADRPKFSDQTGHLIGRWVLGRTIHRQPGLLPYFYVDGIHEAVKRVVENGGEIVKAPYREGNLWVALFHDPAGNLIGVWQEHKP